MKRCLCHLCKHEQSTGKIHYHPAQNFGIRLRKQELCNPAGATCLQTKNSRCVGLDDGHLPIFMCKRNSVTLGAPWTRCCLCPFFFLPAPVLCQECYDFQHWGERLKDFTITRFFSAVQNASHCQLSFSVFALSSAAWPELAEICCSDFSKWRGILPLGDIMSWLWF